tara:strand:- start:489 stop:1532 length:1044 start_codon:yes stop_codon:yes gene_type:complete
MYKINSNNRIKEIKKKDLIFDIINLKKFKNIFVICDSIIQKKHSKHDIFKSNFHIINIDSPEISKNFKTVSDIIKQLSKNNATRDTLLIGLGGGAITDIVGFVASIYMRGIEHIFIPTTLLSMVDASIGGKTGINFQNIKNLVGTFKNPNAIYIDIDFLSTLKKDIIIDGFSEIIKYGLIFDKFFFDDIIKNFNYLINLKDKKKIEKIIMQSHQFKMQAVLEDRFDQNQRMVLNFGHTIGHALEANNKNMSHGQAIYAGMIIESFISYRLNLLSLENFLIIKNFLSPILTFSLNSIDSNKVLKFITFDKKQLNNAMHFVLLEDIGKTKIKKDIDDLAIIDAINEIDK